MAIERILITTDMTERSLAMARSALALARAHDAQAVLFHAVPPLVDLGPSGDLATYIDTREARARARLDQAVGRARNATVEVVVARAVSAILERAARWPADLVVLGARPAGDPWRLLVGSTTLQVVPWLDCPALVLRGPLGPARFSRPLVAIDFSDSSRDAVAAAAALAEPQTWLELIHVVEAPMPLPEVLAETASRRRAEALEQLEDFAARIDLATVAIRSRAELGRVAGQIVEIAETSRCDLIAVGARRRDNPEALLGTITDRVLRRATMPVLIVPPVV